MIDQLTLWTTFEALGLIKTDRLDLKTIIETPAGGPGAFSRRSIEDAVFTRDQFRFLAPWLRLSEDRQHRNQQIRDHYEQCALAMIDRIEKAEGWAEIDHMEQRG